MRNRENRPGSVLNLFQWVSAVCLRPENVCAKTS